MYEKFQPASPAGATVEVEVRRGGVKAAGIDQGEDRIAHGFEQRVRGLAVHLPEPSGTHEKLAAADRLSHGVVLAGSGAFAGV